MKIEEIERLLAKFYGGNTTESEEEVLKDYFRTEDVPISLQKERELFLGFFCLDAVPEDCAPAGLGDKLSRMIDEKAEEEQLFFHRNRSKRNWRWIGGGIAATLLLLTGLGYSIGTMESEVCPPTPQDTFSNPKVAYEVLQATLLEVSANLNKGIEQVQEAREDVTKINKEILNEIQQ